MATGSANGATPDPELALGFNAAQAAEALINYSVADETLDSASRFDSASGEYFPTFSDDEHFWCHLLPNYLSRQNAPVSRLCIFHAAITEWVARVPGLYWQPASAAIRRLSNAAIELETEDWKIYKPHGKSQQVSGGVGTIKFPPAADGYRLVTLTASYNGSTGVPALISPDVWERHKLGEGIIIIDGHADWRPLPLQWARQFPIVRRIPRGCLIINNLDCISETDGRAPILVHPFSVMEYWDDAAQFHDFVYASADTSQQSFRRDIETFFEKYRKDKGRQGVYLTSADISDPMWDSVFVDPEDMRSRKAAQLRLIQARINDTAQGKGVVAALVKALSHLPSLTDLRRISYDAGIDPNRWSGGGLLIEESARLVEQAIELEKQEALLHTVLSE